MSLQWSPLLSPAQESVLSDDLRATHIRAQVAVVRALVDQLDYLPSLNRSAEGIRAQLLEEFARLGCSILEAAADLSRTVEPTPPVMSGGGAAAGSAPAIQEAPARPGQGAS
jgi:hypothetical protein